MTRDARHIALVVVLAVMLAIVGGVAGWSMRGERIEPPTTDTIHIHTVDTIRIASVPDTVTSIVTCYVSVPVYVRDTDTIFEPVLVPIHIEHHFARIGEVADVWYSGYMAKIDSARVYKTTVTEIIRQPYEVTVPKNPLLTLDVGIGNHEWKSLDPYVFARATINADKWKIEPYVGYTYSKQPMFGVSVSRSFTLIK